MNTKNTRGLKTVIQYFDENPAVYRNFGGFVAELKGV
jgi:hypothetical protein